MTDPIEQIHNEPLWRLASKVEKLVRGRLWLQVLAGLLLGVVLGIALGPSLGWVAPETARPLLGWIALPGRLFLSLIQMVVIPLVFASVIRGLGASDDMAQLKALGSRASLYFLATTTVAIVLGLGTAMLIRPGRFIDPASVGQLAGPDLSTAGGAASTSVPDAIVGLIPQNPLASLAGGEMLQVILFAVIMGIAMVSMPQERSAPLFDLLGSLQEVCMTIVKWAMKLAPVAVFGLIAQLAASAGLGVLAGVAGYAATVLLGLFLLVLVYALLLRVLAGRRVHVFMRDAGEALLLAFSTSSSAVTMPLSLMVAEEKLSVRPPIARFVIPLATTINMDGTALYQGVATVFLAQVFEVPLDMADLALVVVTAVGASIGSPATPGVGIVILASVLSGVGIPAAGIALIIGVDRLLDMSRTAVNVMGDLTACTVLDRWVPASTAEPASAK